MDTHKSGRNIIGKSVPMDKYINELYIYIERERERGRQNTHYVNISNKSEYADMISFMQASSASSTNLKNQY